MRKVNAIIERASDGSYSIYSDADDLTYLITGTGKTVAEAKKYFEGGYEDMRRCYQKIGKKFTEVEMVYKYDMASFLSYYASSFTLAGLSRITGINQGQLSHYVTGRSVPTRKTVQKMENAIHAFADDLKSVQFI
jgi:hypothetical protein